MLVFPDVRFDGAYETVIRIANTNDTLAGSVSVACFFMDWNKYRSAVQFDLTHNQPIILDPRVWFGESIYKKGELKCIAVNTATGAQITWNHLIGTATNADQL